MINKWKRNLDHDLKLLLKDLKRDYRLHLVSPIFFNGLKDFLQRKGKRIRPLLFLMSYAGYTKRKFSYKKLLRSSLSLELLHDFMLVHDDVIDKSSLRRGKPTLQRVFNTALSTSRQSELGANLSIVAGDLIFALSIKAFLSIEEDLKRKELALKKFTEAVAFTSIGEFIDVCEGSRKIEEINKSQIFLNYTLKTAKYTFECPLLTAGILAGVNKNELSQLSKMAIFFGQAFQLQDDLLGILSTSKKIGKPILCDLAESKKTLLVWKAYKSLNITERRILKRILEKKSKNYRDFIKFKSLIKKSGAHIYCQKKINSLLKKGNTILSRLKMKKKFKTLLTDFLARLFSKEINP